MGSGPNLVLTGFMGSGKSAVGEEVARRLGRPFVDMDKQIEARAGKSITSVFAENGEAAFREMEAALCRELAGERGLVIATGGGTLVDPRNRESMIESGVVVCLTCGVDRVLQRLDAAGDRPLIKVDDRRIRIEQLLADRRAAYSAIPWQIDTTDRSVEEVTEDVIGLASLTEFTVRHPGGKYPVYSGLGLLANLGGALRAAGLPERARVAVVSNPVVHRIYGEAVTAALRVAGFRPSLCLIPDGERYKTLDSARHLYDSLLRQRLDRTSLVLSLGGGVVGDVAGFVAATFMRGVRFAQVPTTLLAMVDASVGGKTGVDLPQGKNLVGCFKQPELVMIDPTFLETLPDEELRSGLVETIKHGILGDPDLFDDLAHGGVEPSSWWEEEGRERIERAVRVKIDVVEEDPFEGGRRAILNLGHTVGHALEKLSGFALRHGEAVGIGIVAATRIAAKSDMTSTELVETVEAALRRWEVPVRCPPHSTDAIWRAMAFDKKRQQDGLRWALPRGIGDVIVTDKVPPGLVRTVLHDMGARRS